MDISVYNISGSKSDKKISLSDDVFCVQPNDHAIYLDVKQYLANQRQGTHKSKEKAEVSASTRKIKRQKGTGGARAGSLKSPVFRGGGRVFGPRPRDYHFKLNKKLKDLARKSAISYKIKEDAFVILDVLNIDTPKTKSVEKILKSFDLLNKRALFVLGESNKDFYLSTKNLSKVECLEAKDVNTYSLLNADKVFITESGINKIQEILS